ncbi:MAG: 4-(cytidine 5'-diphospho)-2-C-methyl-D-erythritol kinase [Pseudomonadota bacterium]
MERSAPAKLNLYLKVLRRRPDGYHDLVSLMAPIDLEDRLEIELGKSSVRLRCACGLPEDSQNLAFQAATLFLLEAGERGIQAGARIYLEKHIPVGAGLGGGSSDAACVLLTLNDLCDSPFSNTELQVMARRLGADVPFFIGGVPAIAHGIGERLRPVSVPPFWCVLVNPGFPVRTKTVYSNLALPLTPADEESMVKWLMGAAADPAAILHNDLETSTFRLHPGLIQIKQALRAEGAEGSLMSGSGSTVFGLFKTSDAAYAAAERLRRHEDWAVSVQSGPWPGR